MQHSAGQLSNQVKCSHQCQHRLISMGGSGGFHLCHSRCTLCGWGTLAASEKTMFQDRLYLCTWPENHVSRKLLTVCFHLLYKRYWEAWPSSLCFCFLSTYYAHLFMCTHNIVNISVKTYLQSPFIGEKNQGEWGYWSRKFFESKQRN